MQNTTNDMTRGNSMKLIFQFFLPILIGNLFQQLYSFVDSMVVGKESEIRRLPQLEIQAPFIF